MVSLTVEEMNTQLQMQVNALNASLNSLQQSFDAQTALITQLNQTIQELRFGLEVLQFSLSNCFISGRGVLETIESRFKYVAAFK